MVCCSAPDRIPLACWLAIIVAGCAQNPSPSAAADPARVAVRHGAPLARAPYIPLSRVTGHQWTVDPSGGITDGLNLWSVALNARGNIGFTVGDGGLVLRWDGVAWKRDEGAMKIAAGGIFHAVALDPSGTRGLAVGGGGLVMSWNGTSWKHEPAAEKLAIGRYLVAAAFDAKGHTAWVVGQYGMALHWNGSKWTRAQTPFSVPGFVEGGAPVDAFGMWAVWIDPNGVDAWASGNSSQVLRWNGHTWKVDAQGTNQRLTPDAFSGMTSIAMSRDGHTGWMIGGGAILRRTGSKWKQEGRLDGSANDLNCISLAADADAKTVFSVGLTGLVRRLDRAKWTTDESARAEADNRDLFSVTLNAAGNLGFAAGTKGMLLRWDGKNWKRDPAAANGNYTQLSSVAVSSDGKAGLAVGYGGNSLRWDGATWSAAGRGSGPRLASLWLAPAGDLAFGVGPDGIYRWNGSAWAAEPSGPNLQALSLTPDGRLGFAVGHPGAFYRYDGTAWTPDPQGVKEAGNGTLYAVCLNSDGKVGFACGSNVFLRWDGSAWHRDKKLSKGFFNSICLNAKGDFGFASGDNGFGGTMTQWDGKQWRSDAQANRLITDAGPYCLCLSADGQSGLAVSTQGAVLVWNGVKWRRDAEAISRSLGQHLVAACLDAAGRTGWVAGDEGFLMRYRAIESPAGRSGK